jgi:hypothetical protein
VKKNLKPYADKQSESGVKPDHGVLFVERTGELRYAARLRLKRLEPQRKRV